MSPDVLQMLGCAVRPQYDTYNVIITNYSEIQGYLSSKNQHWVIARPQAHPQLQPQYHIGIILNHSEAVKRLSDTYL